MIRRLCNKIKQEINYYREIRRLKRMNNLKQLMNNEPTISSKKWYLKFSVLCAILSGISIAFLFVVLLIALV